MKKLGYSFEQKLKKPSQAKPSQAKPSQEKTALEADKKEPQKPKVEPAKSLTIKTSKNISTKPKRIWTWIALGSAAAVAIVAVGVGVSYNKDASDIEGKWSDYVSGESPSPGYSQGDVYDTANKALATNILYGVAGALAVTSVVLYFVEGHKTQKQEDKPETTPKLWLVFGKSNGVFVKGHF